MDNLTDFIESERKKRQQEVPQPVQKSANVRMSLMDLKNSLDGHVPSSGNPILEKIKQVDVIAEKKNPNTNFIEPSVTNQKPVVQNQRVQATDLNEKEDQFTRDLLMKTRSFLTGVENIEPVKKQIKEEFIQPDVSQYKQELNQQNVGINKNVVMDALKDTITELYVKERVENIIKDYLTSDEGKRLIKSLVVGLFKKK